MSYTEEPVQNPYAAPESGLIFEPVAKMGAFPGWAGFWKRFAAYIIDNLVVTGIYIVGLLLVAVTYAVAQATSGQQTANTVVQVATIVFVVVYLVAVIWYYAGMTSSRYQATLGKLALGIKVTDIHGQRISFGRAVARMFAMFLSAIPLYIGFMMAGWTEKKQCLHDMVVGTYVINKD